MLRFDYNIKYNNINKIINNCTLARCWENEYTLGRVEKWPDLTAQVFVAFGEMPSPLFLVVPVRILPSGMVLGVAVYSLGLFGRSKGGL